MPADSLQISDEADEPQSAEPGRKGWFKKGQSGNPAGRARGSRNRKTLLAQQLFDGEAEALVRKVIEMALAGDPTAIKLCIDRIAAPKRDRVVELALPKLKSGADLARVMGAVTGAAGDGRITPAEAQAFAQTVATAMQAIEMSDIEKRVQEVEKLLADEEAAHPTVDPAYARIAARQGRRLP